MDDCALFDDLVTALGRAMKARRPSLDATAPFDPNAGPIPGRSIYVPPGTPREVADALFAAAHPAAAVPAWRKRRAPPSATASTARAGPCGAA